MPTYSKLKEDGDAHEILRSVLEEFRPDLLQVQIKIDMLMAYPTLDKDGIPTGPAVSHDGYPAYAKVKITSLVDRNLGVGDAVITLDGQHWKTLAESPNGEARKRALLDHELYHLEIDRDKEGAIKADDIGRPKLKIRRHDWQIGGFREVAQRHGQHAYEQSQLKHMIDLHSQLVLPFTQANQGDTTVTLSTGGKDVTVTMDQFNAAIDVVRTNPGLVS